MVCGFDMEKEWIRAILLIKINVKIKNKTFDKKKLYAYKPMIVGNVLKSVV